MRRLIALAALAATPVFSQVCDQSFTLRNTNCPAGATDCTKKSSSLTWQELDANFVNAIDVCNALDVTGTDIDVEGDWAFLGDLAIPTGTAFPGSPTTNDVFIITDDSTAGACDSAAGSALSLCYYNGASWEKLGDGGGSGASAGATGNVQYSSDGAGGFGAEAAFSYDSTNNVVDIKALSDGSPAFRVVDNASSNVVAQLGQAANGDGNIQLKDDADASVMSAISSDASGALIGTDGRIQIGEALTAASSACISNSSDQLYHDTDCDNTKDGGEEFMDFQPSSGYSTDHDAGTIVEADLDEDSGTPTDEDVLTYDSTGANFNWVAQSTLAAGTATTASNLAADGLDDMGEISATIKRGPDATDTHILTTDESAPGSAQCLEMDTDGSVILAGAACGSGGGDSIEIEDGDDGGTFTAIDTTARFEDQGDINFTFADGGAGGPDTVTATVRANSVALGTDTTNNYVATVADAGNSTITVTGSGSESAAVTLDAVDLNCTNCIGDTEVLTNAGTSLADDLEEEGEIGSATISGSAIDHAAIVGTGAGTAAWTGAIPDCNSNNMLTFTQSTNSWGCDADDGAGGGAPVGVQYFVGAADATLTAEKIGADGQGIDMVVSGGDAGSVVWDLMYTDTLAGNPSFDAEECVFSTDGAASGGFLCEGTTANDNEQLYLFPSSDGADTTNYFALGASDGDALAGDSATDFFDAGTIDEARLDANVVLDSESPAAGDVSGDFATGLSVDSVQADSITLATDTTGDFVQNITAGAGLSSSGAVSGENIAHTLSTASSEADFLASGALTCGASTQGKAQVHTTPLQYCDNAGTPTLQYAAYGNSSGEATSVATGVCGTGATYNSGACDVDLGTSVDLASEVGATILPIANGGLNADNSGVVGDAEILVYDGVTDNAFESVPVSGDVSISAAGAVTIQSGVVEDTMMFNEDFGDFSCTSSEDGCSIDSNALTSADINEGAASWDFSSTTTTFAANDIASSELATEVRSIYFGAASLSSDGTNCENPAEVEIGSWGKMFTIICTNNNSSTITGTVGMMDGWDGGTLTIHMDVIQDAADTGALQGDVSARCVGDTETPAGYGSEVALDDTMTGSDARNTMVTASGVTPAGTCAAGDLVQFQYQVDSGGTGTAMATLNIVGFRVEYTTNIGD